MRRSATNPSGKPGIPDPGNSIFPSPLAPAGSWWGLAAGSGTFLFLSRRVPTFFLQLVNCGERPVK